jgi:hypothetical protein
LQTGPITCSTGVAVQAEKGNIQDLADVENNSHASGDSEPNGEDAPHDPPSRGQGLGGKAAVALTAMLLFLALVILQLIGFRKAVVGLRKTDIRAYWCSPIFQAFAIAVADGNCYIRTMIPNVNNGLGCVALPAYYQRSWLRATVALLSLSLIFQVFDMLIISLVRSHHRWRGAKMRRPWFSMFTGVLILFTVMLFGIFASSTLPLGITEQVIIFRFEPSLGGMTACRGKLTPAGIRGSIIGWSDGIFHSWNQVYFGQSVN